MHQRSPLEAHSLRFHVTASELIELDQHAGSAVRGALFVALWRRFCVNKEAPTCSACPLNATCPVASLVAPLRDENSRGRDVPRPFVIQPPLAQAQDSGDSWMRFEAGQPFTFGLTLIGSATKLLPYVVLAAQVMEPHGIGRPSYTNGGRRGRFTIERIDSIDPFAATTQPL